MLYRKLQSNFRFRPVITSHLIITDACFLYIDLISCSFFFYSLICLFTDQISKFGRSSKINFFVKRMWSKHSVLPWLFIFIFFSLKVLITRKKIQENNQQKCWVLYFSYTGIFISKVFLHDGKKTHSSTKKRIFWKGKNKKYNFNWNVFVKPATK